MRDALIRCLTGFLAERVNHFWLFKLFIGFLLFSGDGSVPLFALGDVRATNPERRRHLEQPPPGIAHPGSRLLARPHPGLDGLQHSRERPPAEAPNRGRNVGPVDGQGPASLVAPPLAAEVGQPAGNRLPDDPEQACRGPDGLASIGQIGQANPNALGRSVFKGIFIGHPFLIFGLTFIF